MNENSQEYIELKKFFQKRNPEHPLDCEQFLKTKKLEDADERTKKTSYSAYLFLYYHQYNKNIKHMVEEEIENGFPNTKTILEDKKKKKNKPKIQDWIGVFLPLKRKKRKKTNRQQEQEKEKENEIKREEEKASKAEQKKSHVRMPIAYKVVASVLGIIACISTYHWGYSLDIANAQTASYTPLLTTAFLALSGVTVLTAGSIHQSIKQARTDNIERLKEEIEEEQQEKEMKKEKKQDRAPLFVSKELSNSSTSFEENQTEEKSSKDSTYHLKKDEKVPVSVEFNQKESLKKNEDMDLSINIEKVTKDTLEQREVGEKIEEILNTEETKQDPPVTKGLRLS